MTVTRRPVRVGGSLTFISIPVLIHSFTSKALTMNDQRIEQERQLRGIFTQLRTQPSSVVESETIEIKSWCRDGKQLAEKASESSACLANSHGGVVLLGIEDDDRGHGKFSKCKYSNVTCDWIVQRIQDSTVPPVEIKVVDASQLLQETTGVVGANCFAIFLSRSKRIGGHQTISGHSKIRSGKDCRPYYSAVVDDRSKVPVIGASVCDLSKPSIVWGMQQHKKKFNIASSLGENDIDFLAQIGLLELNPEEENSISIYQISLAGLLLFGTVDALKRYCPGLETIIETPLETKRITNNIVETYKQLCGSSSSLLPSLCPYIPDRCIKEILMNSFVHRDYRNYSPIIIRVSEQSLEFESPGSLCSGLSVESLLYCTPVYRNFLVAEGSRYLGLCDKVGQGINLVYQSVLQKGLGFPIFENGENHFTTRISVIHNGEFQEFLKRRVQSLTQLDEIIVLRFLLDRGTASFRELCAVMQRGTQAAHKILTEMKGKNMIESNSALNTEWKLSQILQNDIQNIFRDDQFSFGFGNLYGDN
jgi:ATP-dependent DNA helicase RecG